MMTATSLHKQYGSTVAVDGLSFEVQDGQVTGFLGPNGSGKSTTMRLMLGLDHGGGRTTFDGLPLPEVPSATRAVGAHLDAKYFHPKRPARAHLRMLATEARLPDSRVDEVLEVFGLTSVANKRPRGFSLGMGQRLGLAGAVLSEPRNLMLDEPANGLDPQSIQWLRDFLRHYAARGNAVLVSSHLLSEMQLMADHVVVIAKGALVADSALTDLVETSTRNDVLLRVRAQDAEPLARALAGAGISVPSPPTVEGESAVLVVATNDPGPVGMAAFSAGVPVLELSLRMASLEQAFLDLTAGREQFKTGTDEIGGAQ
jgi:ABC-2 type transport system ATP-binding protein